jgi:hypothetical protein
MPADNLPSSASVQPAKPKVVGNEPRILGRDDVNRARELISGKADDSADRRGPTPKIRDDEGGRPPATRDPQKGGSEYPERRTDANLDAKVNRPALELDDDDEQSSPKRRKHGKTIADYAAELEVDPQELYSLSVPLGDDSDDQPLTIGEMKDRIKEVRDFDRRRDDFEDYRDQSLNEVANARQQIEGVLSRITQVIPPDQLASAFSDYQYSHEQQVSASRLQLREWFPEWDDVQVKTRDREKLDSFLGSYGFSRYEIDNLVDARLVRFSMHAMKLMERYERLKNGGTREKVPTTEPTSSRKQQRRDPKTEAQNLARGGDVLGGVRKLLG